MSDLSSEEPSNSYTMSSDIRVRDIQVGGPHGPVPCRLYKSTTPGPNGLVWAHGGKFVGGDLDMPEAHWVALSLASLGVTVLSVDYRKAVDGVHFPVPSDDLLAAWLWASTNLERVAGRALHIHIGGASAGGTLAAGVTKRLRDGAGPTPTSVLLAYAVLHAVLPPASAELCATLSARGDISVFDTEIVREIGEHYAGTAEHLADPYAFAGNGAVSGQPPTYVLNSQYDSLRASGEEYAQQLLRGGVVVKLETERGSQHGHLNEPSNELAQRSIGRLYDWLTGQWGA